ncbi:MAG: response regulator transcription factor, partial [Hymenobacter sp.]
MTCSFLYSNCSNRLFALFAYSTQRHINVTPPPRRPWVILRRGSSSPFRPSLVAPTPAQSKPAPAKAAAYKILVVDDDPDIVELLEFNLKKEGYLTASAGDGRRALEVAADFGPDIILLDVMMPHLDGIATCRQLREQTRFKDTYILFLTARAEEFSEVAAFEAGADDFIAKPIKPRALLSRLAAVVRRDQDPHAGVEAIDINGLRIDRTAFAVYQEGQQLKLLLGQRDF